MTLRRPYPPSICPGIPRLGKCPRGWTTRTFGQILSVVERSAAIADDTEYQLVNAKRSRGGIVPRERLKGREIKTKGQYFVHAGDFLIANRQIIHGACGIVPPALDGSLVSGEYTVLHANDGLSLQWFAAFTHTPYFQLTCFHSSIGVDVEKMVFKLDWWLKHELHVPPLAEQTKIADVSATWDESIEQTRALLDAAKRRKTGLMQRLLTGKKRLAGFGLSGGRRAVAASGTGATARRPPKGWAETRFGSVVTRRRETWDSSDAATGAPCVELENIEQETGRLLGLSQTTRDSCLKSRFQRYDVLFGKLRPYLRKFHLAQESGLCSSEIWVLTTKASVGGRRAVSTDLEEDVAATARHPPTLTPEYLFFLVQTDEFLRAATVATGSKMPRAEWSNVAAATFVIPPLPEQHAIAAVLTTADEEIASLEAKAAALERQKKGLMQKLLTGEVRATV